MQKMMQLREDPELKDIFADIEANGAGAMEKYWDDTDLMSKISQKMAAMNMGPKTPPRSADTPSKVGVSSFSSENPPSFSSGLPRNSMIAYTQVLECQV